MPNFHTHWLVAYGAISRAPEPVRKGADAFLKAGSDLRTQLKLALEEPRLEAVQAAANDAMKTWKKAVEAKKDNIKDNITCFSAYMLGACGPDFWTLPSGKRNVPDTADFLFNLGHYNRTHRQFQVSVARQESREDTPKARAEQANPLDEAVDLEGGEAAVQPRHGTVLGRGLPDGEAPVPAAALDLQAQAFPVALPAHSHGQARCPGRGARILPPRRARRLPHQPLRRAAEGGGVAAPTGTSRGHMPDSA